MFKVDVVITTDDSKVPFQVDLGIEVFFQGVADAGETFRAVDFFQDVVLSCSDFQTAKKGGWKIEAFLDPAQNSIFQDCVSGLIDKLIQASREQAMWTDVSIGLQ